MPVDRPPATNPAGIVVGLLRNFTERHPEGMERVTLLGDPTRALGALAEPECRRIMAALDLAEELGVPLEWFALSAGARIAMDSGTENMDWIAAVLRRIIEFTQRGGEINVVVAGINVGAQPYWNAEATMLMHTKGILVMTPGSAMVLTGKLSLDYSGGVSADDNFGIGGYERIMGPNGQAQYWAATSPPRAGSSWPTTSTPTWRRVSASRGERARRIRSSATSVARRTPWRGATWRASATCSRTSQPRAQEAVRHPVGDERRDRRGPSAARALGRDRDAEVGIVWDAHLGGWPMAMIGIESHVLLGTASSPRTAPSGGRQARCSRARQEVARAVNAASGRRALVVLANLAGFDGSPDRCANGSSSSVPRSGARS